MPSPASGSQVLGATTLGVCHAGDQTQRFQLARRSRRIPRSGASVNNSIHVNTSRLKQKKKEPTTMGVEMPKRPKRLDVQRTHRTWNVTQL